MCQGNHGAKAFGGLLHDATETPRAGHSFEACPVGSDPARFGGPVVGRSTPCAILARVWSPGHLTRSASCSPIRTSPGPNSEAQSCRLLTFVKESCMSTQFVPLKPPQVGSSHTAGLRTLAACDSTELTMRHWVSVASHPLLCATSGDILACLAKGGQHGDAVSWPGCGFSSEPSVDAGLRYVSGSAEADEVEVFEVRGCDVYELVQELLAGHDGVSGRGVFSFDVCENHTGSHSCGV
jgi:hypothetical protein